MAVRLPRKGGVATPTIFENVRHTKKTDMFVGNYATLTLQGQVMSLIDGCVDA